jgi:hypothetical protein
MENKNSNVELLFGLETYAELLNSEKDREFIHDIINVLRSENVNEALFEYCLKRLDRDELFRSIKSFSKTNDIQIIKDGLSRSQIRSKIWLIEELFKLGIEYKNLLIMGSWFGQLVSIYDKRLKFEKIRLIDLEKSLCEASDYNFNLKYLENYRVKSICADINQLTLHKNGYEWPVENFKEGTSYVEKFLPDLIINTSAEHMTEEWFHQIRFKEMENNPIVAIQSNNMFDGEGHVNCVHSIDHMKKKFPMREILFEGELQLKGYKRVMLIGRL